MTVGDSLYDTNIKEHVKIKKEPQLLTVKTNEFKELCVTEGWKIVETFYWDTVKDVSV